MKGEELEMTVPEGCQPGDAILVDLLPGGATSKTAAKEKKRHRKRVL